MKRPILASLAALSLSACLFGGNDGSDSIQGRTRDLGAYSVEGNSLILAPREYVNRYCDGSQLIEHKDTTSGDTTPFVLTGNQLKFSFNYTESGYTIRQWLITTRQGSGSGFAGTWRGTGMSYEVIAGSLPDSEKIRMDTRVAKTTELYSERLFLITFAHGKMTTFEETRYAEDFVDNWNGVYFSDYADSARYDIDVRLVDAKTVELHGRKNGETVRIAYSADGDETYTSSNPDHLPGTRMRDPKTCPSDEPAWYSEFLSANYRLDVLQKKAAPGGKPLSPWPFP